MLVEFRDDAGRHAAAVRPSVERQVLPPIRIPLVRSRRKVRRVREHPVEPPETASEVGPDRGDGESLGEGDRPHPTQGVGVAIGRHDPAARAGRGEGEESESRADIEQGPGGGPAGEREQEKRVLPRRVDRRFRRPRRRRRPPSSPVGAMPSYPLHA